MAIINLREFYPWYTHDEFIDVSGEVADELLADKRYHKNHDQRIRRNKAYYSLDIEDGIETAAIIQSSCSPESALEMKDRHCRLCRAINSLPEVQGRRIEAHYIQGRSKAEIARAEGVTEKNVRQSIERGLQNMRRYLKNIH